jgi:hypothetical protein
MDTTLLDATENNNDKTHHHPYLAINFLFFSWIAAISSADLFFANCP